MLVLRSYCWTLQLSRWIGQWMGQRAKCISTRLTCFLWHSVRCLTKIPLGCVNTIAVKNAAETFSSCRTHCAHSYRADTSVRQKNHLHSNVHAASLSEYCFKYHSLRRLNNRSEEDDAVSTDEWPPQDGATLKYCYT